jgi:hypothetical protein
MLVGRRRNLERPELTIPFRDVNPTIRLRLIAAAE